MSKYGYHLTIESGEFFKFHFVVIHANIKTHIHTHIYGDKVIRLLIIAYSLLCSFL